MTCQCYLFIFLFLSPIFGQEHSLFLSILYNEGAAFLVTHCHSCVILPTWKKEIFLECEFPKRSRLFWDWRHNVTEGELRRERAQSSSLWPGLTPASWKLAGSCLPALSYPGQVAGGSSLRRVLHIQQLMQEPRNTLNWYPSFLLFQDIQKIGGAGIDCKQWTPLLKLSSDRLNTW